MAVEGPGVMFSPDAMPKQGGAQVVGEIEAHPNGRFGWFIDPDNNKVELWEPLQVK